jgi:hypothetical protein
MESMPEGGGMAPQPSWWSRNWKWAAPLGCLGLMSCGCLGAIVLGLGALGGGMAALASGPMDDAIHAASQDPEVQRALGSPIHAGGLLNRQVSIQTENGQGHARLHIPLEGPKGHGELDAEAAKEGGKWNFSRLVVEVPGQQDIDLLDTSGGSAPPSPQPPKPPKTPKGQQAPPPPGHTGKAPEGTQDGRDIEL